MSSFVCAIIVASYLVIVMTSFLVQEEFLEEEDSCVSLFRAVLWPIFIVFFVLKYLPMWFFKGGYRWISRNLKRNNK